MAMVDSNLHRENLKPSEKAFAYKMKLDAMKHQGKQLPKVSSVDDGAEELADKEANNVTSAQVGLKCDTDVNGRADNSGNGANEVNEEHSIYDLYLQGYGAYRIAKELTRLGKVNKRAMLSGQTAVSGEFLRMKSTRAICLWEKLTQ